VSASSEVFARLAAEGSDALHRGDDRAAVERLTAALRARDDVDVRADLVEARLRLGLHREVVPELRRLVAEHPGHERLRRQLAVALARSRRRSEALALCRAAPGSPLLDELARAIQSREAVGGDRRRARGLPGRRAGLATVAVAATAAGAALAFVVVDGDENEEPAPQRAAAAARVVRDATSRPATRRDAALPYAVDGDALWASRADRRSVALLGADGHGLRAVAVPGRVDALAAAYGSLWVVDAAGEQLHRISQRTGRRLGSVSLPRGEPGRRGAAAIAVAGGTVWATGGGPLLSLDAGTGRGRAFVSIDGPTALVADAEGVWVGTRTGELVRVARRGRPRVSRFPGVPGRVVRMLRAHGSLWVARGEPHDANLWRYETTRAAIYGTPLRGTFTSDVTARPGGALWVRLPSSAYARVDAATGRVDVVDREIRPPSVPDTAR
jgi:sugar lactone lactonase YvrE